MGRAASSQLVKMTAGGEAVSDSPVSGLEQIYLTTNQMYQHLQRDLSKLPV